MYIYNNINNVKKNFYYNKFNVKFFNLMINYDDNNIYINTYDKIKPG